MADTLVFEVVGTPAPQGSKRAFLPKGATRPVIVDDKPQRLRTWRDDVKGAATDAIDAQGWTKVPAGEEIGVRYTFHLVRPKTVTRAWPCVKPDLDKLERAVSDALRDAGVYADDQQICQSVTIKQYAERPGCTIEVARFSA